MAYIHAIFSGNIPEGYLDDDNISFVTNKITDVLQREYVQAVNVDRASIIRVMERVLEERIETIPKMNQRTVMYICNEFRNHQGDVNKHLKWEKYYIESQRLYDPTVERGPDLDVKTVKVQNGGQLKVGGTVRFYFT
jgi:hypothetical protein